jgi:archaellum component FlaC
MNLREYVKDEIDRLDRDDEGLWQKIEELKKRVDELEAHIYQLESLLKGNDWD